MKKYSVFDEPIKIFGLPEVYKENKLTRLPEELIKRLPEAYGRFGRRCHGARFGFKTNSSVFKIKAEYETLSPDIGMSIFACQSFEVFIGEKSRSEFAGLVYPSDYDTKCFERTFYKGNDTEEITVFFPRNEIVKSIEIFIEDGADILSPDEYKYPVPVVFYGSSITEGGHANNVSVGYNAILSRHLGFDYINLGFSGSAKGETEMAEYISMLDMSVFVYDYDFNADSARQLRDTHSRFFNIIREKHKKLPVIMMSRPKANYNEEEKQRREIIFNTYKRAKDSGDENVYFLDGEAFFGSDDDKYLCSTDGTHPNDLGFYRMAQLIEPILKKILEKI